jgi:hypothetical protein
MAEDEKCHNNEEKDICGCVLKDRTTAILVLMIIQGIKKYESSVALFGKTLV